MDAGTGEWKECVQLVFEYFCERTPRSFVEQRGTSLVWNYKHAGGSVNGAVGWVGGRVGAWVGGVGARWEWVDALHSCLLL